MSLKKEIYALYLPQYHEIPENNEWWGKGYTEWNAVRNAKPLFRGHIQPKVPLDNRYYDLSDSTGETWKWQSKIAKDYGVDGFAIYHYWFKDGKKLLETPMEVLLAHPEVDVNYFIVWANEPWKRTWYQNNGSQVLMPQEYGSEVEWKNHYDYLSKFFKDKRYKKIENKPVVGIYNTSAIEELQEMKNAWNQLAKADGFDGVYLLGAKTAYKQEERKDILEGEYLFEPAYTLKYQYTFLQKGKRAFNKTLSYFAQKLFRINMVRDRENMKDLYKSLKIPKDYSGKEIFYGICPSWDNTPRKQYGGCVFKHSNPKFFGEKLKCILKSNDAGSLVIINAWNEWGEGTYLEPDEYNKYEYLEAIKRAVDDAMG